MILKKYKQTIKHSESNFRTISNVDRSEDDQFLITLSKSIFIFNPLNGSDINHYTIAEITKSKNYHLNHGIVFANQQRLSEDSYFRQARFSPLLKSRGFSLIAACTNDFNLHLFVPPSYSENIFQPNWVNQSSVTDMIYNHIKTTQFDKADDDSDQYLYKVQFQIVDTDNDIKEIHHRQSDLLDTICLDWSPRFSFTNTNIDKSSETLLALGGKRLLTLWKMDLNAQYEEPIEKLIKPFGTFKIGKGWCQQLRWKPTLHSTGCPILAAATSRGEVSLFLIEQDSKMTLIYTICEPDESPITFLEWTPPNEFEESLLIIGRGIAFQIFNPIKKILTDYIINNSNNVSGVSFVNSNQFYTSSLDATIHKYTLSDRFWKSMDITKDLNVERINIPVDENENPPDNYFCCIPSPNNLFFILGENLQGANKMFQKKSLSALIHIYCNVDFENYQLGVINKYTANKNQISKIWDTLMYQRSLSDDQLIEIIDTTIAELDRLQNKKNNDLNDYYHLYKLFIYTFNIIKEQCPNKIIEQWNNLKKLFISKVEMVYIVNVLTNFLENHSSFELTNYENTSLLLMCDWLLEINAENVISEKDKQLSIAKKVYGILKEPIPDPKKLPSREKCIYCDHDIPNNPILSVTGCSNGCPLSRCQRTKLLLNTHELFHCDMCKNKSLIFREEAYQFENQDTHDLDKFRTFNAIQTCIDICDRAPSCLFCGCTFIRRYPFPVSQ